jgi:drug/metabolite transporter (DMT)-like permease
MKWLWVFMIVACTVASDVLQSREMKRHGEITDFSIRHTARALRALSARPGLVVSIGCLAVSFFAFLALLRIAPLSFAVPVTAVTYVADGLLARWVLHEQVNWKRWAGIAMIACGVILLSA